MKTDPEEVKQEVDSLTPFDPQILPKSFSAAIYGARRQGKTTILRDLVYQLRDRFDIVLVFSTTAMLYRETDFSFVPEKNFIDHLDEELIQNILDRRHLVLEQKLDVKLDRMLILLDDIISEKNVFHSRVLSALFSKGRHYGEFSVVILTQHATAINPLIRRNLDLSVVFYPEASSTREIISKEYLSLKDWSTGSEILKLATSAEFAALAIIRNPAARAYNEKAFTYFSTLHEKKFRIRGIFRRGAPINPSIGNKKFNIAFGEEGIN